MWRLFFVVAALCASVSARANVLQNAGYEGTYVVATGNTTEVVSGTLAPHWIENSVYPSATALNVTYAPDTAVFHSGAPSQRVTVTQISSSAIQFYQAVTATNLDYYTGSVWLRADQPMTVTLLIRQAPGATDFSRDVVVGTEWQRVQTTGLINDTTLNGAVAATQIRFYVQAHSLGTLWVDDATLDDLSTTPARVGNLLPNGSFEAGWGGWRHWGRLDGKNATYRQTAEVTDVGPQLDHSSTGQHKDGAQSVLMVVDAGTTLILSSPPVPFTPNRAHTASVWVMSSANASVTLAFDGYTTPALTHSVALTAGVWTQATYTATLPWRPGGLVLSVIPSGTASIYVDAAEVVESSTAPAYTPQAPTELSLGTAVDGNIFTSGPALINVAAAPPPPTGAVLHAEVEDLYGHVTSLGDLPFPIAMNRLSIDPSVLAHPLGLFKVRATVLDGVGGNALSATVMQLFARLPAPRNTPLDRSFFGIHAPATPHYLAIARLVGARWLRLHDTSKVTTWPFVQPNQTDPLQYVDAPVDAAVAAGFGIMGMLDGGAPWVTPVVQPPEFYSRSDYNVPSGTVGLAAWSTYCQSTVAHYQGKIAAWEVWNEPWNSHKMPTADTPYPYDYFYLGTGSDYGGLLWRAKTAAQIADATAIVVGIDTNDDLYSNPPTSFNSVFTSPALMASAGMFDVLSFHLYDSATYGGAMNIGAGKVADLKALVAGAGLQAKDIWVTEGGLPANKAGSAYDPDATGLSPREQIGQAIRFNVSLMSAGVRRFFHYTINGTAVPGQTSYDGLEHDGTIRGELVARAILASLIDGATFTGKTAPQTGVEDFTFVQPDQARVEVVWANDNLTHTLPVSVGATVLDGLGNVITPTAGMASVTNEPIYFATPAPPVADAGSPLADAGDTDGGTAMNDASTVTPPHHSGCGMGDGAPVPLAGLLALMLLLWHRARRA